MDRGARRAPVCGFTKRVRRDLATKQQAQGPHYPVAHHTMKGPL